MKRDLDLIREILLEVETRPFINNDLIPINLEGYSSEQVSYHILLLIEAGFVTASDFSNEAEQIYIPHRLTWHGHEFLDAARNDAHWGKVKQAIGRTGGFAISVIEQLLLESIKIQASKFLT